MTEIKVRDDGGETMTMVDVGGFILPSFWGRTAPQLKEMFDLMPDLDVRNDDIMLAGFPKCGTHWAVEIISMVLNKSAERVKEKRSNTMLERTSVADMNAVQSPRVLSSHLAPRFLPKAMTTVGTKTVLYVRNPKDQAVSYYHHMKGLTVYNYNGQWKNWLAPYVRGEYEFGKYADYLNEWQKFIEDGPAYPIHVMYFEDVKKDGVKEIKKLAKFLDVHLDEQLQNDIVKMCGFDKMKKEMFHFPFSKGSYDHYRKGEVGGWKNMFTAAHDEMFDVVWENSIRKDTMFKWNYKLM